MSFIKKPLNSSVIRKPGKPVSPGINQTPPSRVQPLNQTPVFQKSNVDKKREPIVGIKRNIINTDNTGFGLL